MKTQPTQLPNLLEFEHFKELCKRNTLVSKHEDTPQTHPLHATVISLRLLGRLPLSRDKSGDYSFSLSSWWTFYCLFTMVLQIAMVMNVVSNYYLKKERWNSFDTTVISLMNASLLITMLHAVVFTWKRSRRLAEALNGWKRLQHSFRAVTSNKICSWLLDHPYFGVLIPTSYLIFIEFLPVMLYYMAYSAATIQLKAITFIVYFCAALYVKLVLWFWLVFTHSISQAAKTLRASLTETLARDPSVWRLRLHRALWMEVHKYACAVTAAVGNTVRAWMVTIVFSFYLCIYSTCLSVVNGTNMTITIIPLITRALQTFLLNNASFLAESQITNDFIESILSFNFSHFTEDQLEEIELFLYSIENSPERFSLEHMVKPSRETILDILELALTIMVILLQFRESA